MAQPGTRQPLPFRRDPVVDRNGPLRRGCRAQAGRADIAPVLASAALYQPETLARLIDHLVRMVEQPGLASSLANQDAWRSDCWAPTPRKAAEDR